MMDFYAEDVKGLMSQFSRQEDRLRIKRRWLAGLPISKKEKRLINSIPNRTLPESLLREDDVFYETIKSFVERGVNNGYNQQKQPLTKYMLPLNLPNDDVRYLFSLLHYMTNKCLYTVASELTNGSLHFDKIRWKMIKLIKDHLPKLCLTPNHHFFQKISPLLRDPRSFRTTPLRFLDSSSQSYEAAVVNLLDELDELPTCALLAMHRKLKGIRGYIPQVVPPKHGWKRDKLISSLRKTCVEMLSAAQGDESRELLNKAMGVAVLAFKLLLGNQYVTDLRKFSPDLQVVQMDIAKAIWFLNRRVRFPELNTLQLLLDPGSKLSKRSSRSAIRKLLTEYLFECSDMDTIPGGLLEIVAVINQRCRSVSLKYFSKEDIEKEVECILSVGAHTKQIVWDLSDEHEFDYDFADSYMEDLEDSDDGEYYVNDYMKNEPSDNSRFGSDKRHNPSESVTESVSANFTVEPHNAQDFSSPPYTKNRTNIAELDSMQLTCIDTVDSSGAFSLSSLNTKKTKTESACISPRSFNGHSVMKKEPINYSESNISCGDMSDKKIINEKPYLAIQGASDETSLFVYCLIGRLMEEFAQIEGLPLDLDDVAYLRCGEAKQNEDQVPKEKSNCDKDGYGSVIIQLVQQLWPSFPQSGKDKLEEMMS